MCNECAFKTCDACGKHSAAFCCAMCHIRLCYSCNIGMTVEGLKKIGACPMCGEKLK